METITDVARFAEEADEHYGYANAEAVAYAAHNALGQGQDLILYTNHDLGSLGSRPLATIQAIARDAKTPPHAGDTDYIGLGWRYVPELRLTVEVPR